MTGTRAAREAAIKKAAHLVRTVPIFGRATKARSVPACPLCGETSGHHSQCERAPQTGGPDA